MRSLHLRWVAHDDSLMADASDLRYRVLYEPFGVSRTDEWDDVAPGAHHLIALLDGSLVAYACLLLDADGSAHVRQLSVEPRLQRSGVGSALMREVADEAERLGATLLWLNARTTAEEFYARLGYCTVSGVFPFGRTGLPHVRMELSLGASSGGNDPLALP